MTSQTARRLYAVHDSGMSSTFGFEPYLRANNCGDNTVHYRLAHLADFAKHHPTFPNVTAIEVTNWLGRANYAPWSRATFYGHLHSYFAWAADVGIVAADPMARMRRPRAPKGTPRPLTPEQVGLLMGAARNANLHAWLTLALYSGLRAHEVAKIRGQDVEANQIYVLGKGGRSAFVPTHPLIWEVALSRPRSGWWFPTGSPAGHVSARTVSAITGRLFAANGIEGSIHRCRHTYATNLLRAGVNIRIVQELMRHESLNSTMIYTAVSEGERHDAIALLMAA